MGTLLGRPSVYEGEPQRTEMRRRLFVSETRVIAFVELVGVQVAHYSCAGLQGQWQTGDNGMGLSVV